MDTLLWWLLAGSLSLNIMYMIRIKEEQKLTFWQTVRGPVFAIVLGPLGLFAFYAVRKWID